MALVKCKECNQEISTKADKCPSCGAPQKKKTSLFTKIVLVMMVFGGISLILAGNNQTGSSAPASKSPKEKAMDNLTLDFTWGAAGFGNIMEGDFTISNSNEFAVKDIKILCIGSAKSGTKIDENERVIYDIVPAKGKKVIKKFNMGFINTQVEKMSCNIIHFVM